MKKFFVSLLFVMSAPAFLRAQIANNTSLVGTALDSTGRAVAGAKVVAVEEHTKVVSRAVTNEQGYYSIAYILPGTYDVTVEQPGFSKGVTTGIIVVNDVAVRTDFNLKAGGVTDVVTVSAVNAPLDTDSARLGETFDRQQVEDLPVQGHNALEFAALESNVIIGSKTSYSGNPPGLDFIGAGQRETQNELTLDGVSIMNNLGNEAPARPSSDMVSEVQMQSGNYTAQYGAYLGLHVNVVSKSGTNQFHGDVYDYVKNSALNAHNFFDARGAKKAPLNYNQYGFTLGGPVLFPKLYDGRNKTFFFGSYEKLNQKVTFPGTTTVMTKAMRGGDFSDLGQYNPTASNADPSTGCALPNGIAPRTPGYSCVPLKDPNNPTVNGGYFPGNIIPSSRLTTGAAQIAQKYIAYIPLPNIPDNFASLGSAAFNSNLNNVNYANTLYVAQTLERLDENIGEKVKLFFRFHWQDLTYSNGSPVPVSAGYGPANSRNYAIGYTHIITPNIVNDFHAGVNQFLTAAVNYWYKNGLKSAGTDLGIPGFNYDTTTGQPGVPNISVTNASGMNIGNNGSNWFQDDRTLNAYDQVSYAHGKHSFIAGIEFRKLETGRIATNLTLGQFTFNGQYTNYGASDFLLGLASGDQTPTTSIKGSVAEWRDGFFVLDNWQATTKLTINYGLRYDLPTVPYSLNGYVRTMNASQTQLLPVSTANSPSTWTPVPGYKLGSPTHDNWGPRLGFAYRVLPKTVIRGGGGFFYNANQLNSFTLLTSNNYPFGTSFNYSASQGTTANPLSFTNPTPGQANASPVTGTCTPNCTYGSAVTYDPANKTQRSYQWNLSAGQELWRGAAAELQYVGSHSFDLDTSWYDNEPTQLLAGQVFTQPTRANINSAQGSCGQATCLVRPNQLFGSVRDLRNFAYAHYNGMTAILRQRSFHGLSGSASYTWSHSLDISSDSNGGGLLSQPYNIRADYGNANWDIRNRFVGVLSYQLPSFNQSNLLVRETLGGWQVNSIITIQSGMPFNVTLSTNSAGNSQGSTRPSWVHAPKANCSLKNVINNVNGSAATGSCFDLSAYALPVAPSTVIGSTTVYNYAYGNTSRNTLFGPGFQYVNLSVFKTFSVKEAVKFQFRAEAANVFNHPSAANPSSSLSGLLQTSTQINTAGVGTITGLQSVPGELSGNRVLQLAGKIIF